VILQRLCEAASRFDFPPTGYQTRPVKWLVALDAQGEFLGFMRTTGDETRRVDRGKEIAIPFVLRTSGVAAQLLADRADYALGHAGSDPSEKEIKNTLLRHGAFIALLDKFVQESQFPPAQAVRQFFDSGAHMDLPADLEPADLVTFQVDGKLLVDEPDVRKYWAAQEAVRNVSGAQGDCLVCGRVSGIASPHPLPIKRVPGGQTSGCALVSVNARAFDSYGHSQDLSQCPVCWDCARDYAQVLNALLADPAHHFRLQDRISYVFWTKKATEFNPTTMFFSPAETEVKALLASVHEGRPVASLEGNQFYALALSGSGGRVVIRDWLETTVAHVEANLARYFQALDVVDHEGQPGPPLGLYALLGALIPSQGQNPWRELSPNLASQFVRSALSGGNWPAALLGRAVLRARQEQGLTRPRAALIKVCLLLSGKEKEGLQLYAELNASLREPAYLCGRLLAILESVQRAAIPGAKATMVDRYYGSASSAPASVFGLLMRQAQAHLSKLRKTSEGAHFRLQRDLEEVTAGLPAFPATLRLNEQGLFALGYYQQRAADRAAMLEARSRKASSAPTDDSTGGTGDD